MDKAKILRLVLIPIVLALVVTLVVQQVLERPTASSKATSPAVEMAAVVAVAGPEPITARTKITDTQLILKQVPTDLLTGQEIATVHEANGMIALVQLEPGEVVLKSRLVQEGSGTLPYRIPAGMRALTLKIDEYSGVAGHPKSGDRVDLIGFLSEKSSMQRFASTQLIAESVMVLDKGIAGGAPVQSPTLDSPTLDASTKISSVTLALTPAAAVEVALFEQIGYIKLILRPALSEGTVGSVLSTESLVSPDTSDQWR